MVLEHVELCGSPRRARIGIVSADARPARGAATAGDPTPEQLLVAAGTGDDAAFAGLYDRLAGLVYGVCLRVLRIPSDAEEVTQEVFVEIWRTAPRFDPSRGSARAWCVAIAHSRAVDRVRSSERRRAREDVALRPDPDPGDVVPEQAAALLAAEGVRRAVADLHPRHRDPLLLAYWGGHTQSEIAGMLGLPLGTVKTRIRDALARLRGQVPHGGELT